MTVKTPPGEVGMSDQELVAWLLGEALRWGYEAAADEQNEAWPDTTIVFNAGEIITALERKRYREACDAARSTNPYLGGPVDWDTGRPRGGPQPTPPPEPPYARPRFPTLAEQSTWLTPEDVAFCLRYAREHQ